MPQHSGGERQGKGTDGRWCEGAVGVTLCASAVIGHCLDIQSGTGGHALVTVWLSAQVCDITHLSVCIYNGLNSALVKKHPKMENLYVNSKRENESKKFKIKQSQF